MTNKTSPRERKLSPEEYKRILKTVHLDDISLSSSSTQLRRDQLIDDLKIYVNGKPSYETDEERNIFIDYSYELLATSKTKRDYAFKISCSFRLKYRSEQPVEDGFMEIFLELNVPVNIWPYFREFVQNMMARMNLPPLTLGLLR